MFRVLRTSFVWAAVLGSFPVGAQSPAFEVASVKPNVYRGPGKRFPRKDAVSQFEISGTRVRTMGNLPMLVAAAYGIERFQVSQSPDWKENWPDSEMYDVDARAPGDSAPSLAEVRRMMQTLLVERFQLKVSRGSLKMDVYNLLPAAGGAKLEPTSFADSPPVTRDEGSAGARVRTRFLNYTIAAFARTVMGQFDRPLVDRTGLTGGYDFSLEYTWQAPNMTPAAIEALGLPDPEPGLPIVASLREQLGLRVVPVKGTVDTVVIDRAERPSAN
ncbi:MAG: TIGR03435 family protein [Ignavibacteriota bacterium]